MSTDPVTSYFTQSREPGFSHWVTMIGTHGDEVVARASYADWLAAKLATGSRTEYRFVRRTAVITDEVLDVDDQVRVSQDVVMWCLAHHYQVRWYPDFRSWLHTDNGCGCAGMRDEPPIELLVSSARNA